MSDITLRDATEADVTVIFTITQAAFEEYRGVLVPPSSVERETHAVVRQKLASGHYILAEYAGAPVAAVYYEVRPESVYLGRLSVLPQARQRGLARLLVAEVERRAVQVGRAKVELAVRAMLPALRASYERMGYRIVAEQRHPGFETVTYTELAKDLAPDPGRPNEEIL